MSATVRIVVADGHPLYRRGLTALLASHPGWTVVAQEDTGAGAVAAALRSDPDLVVMDLDLPHPPADQAVREIAAGCPGAAVLVLTGRDDGEAMARVLRAGARGCARKTPDHAPVLRAVAAVAQGDVLLPAAAARHLLTGSPELSSREREVLELVAAGWSADDVAKVLVVDSADVDEHLAGVVAKLHAAGADAPIAARVTRRRRSPRPGRRR